MEGEGRGYLLLRCENDDGRRCKYKERGMNGIQWKITNLGEIGALRELGFFLSSRDERGEQYSRLLGRTWDDVS